MTLAATVLAAPSDLAAAKERLKVTQRIYASINIRLAITLRRTTGSVPTFTGTQNAKFHAAIAYAKQQVRGVRPANADLVLYLTPQLNGAGFADCIGGIAHPDRAFAAAGLLPRGGGNTKDDGTIAAHEIGHLLGAQHHYGNCAEAQPKPLLEDEDLGTCTLMFAYSITPTVGTLERMYMHDYVRTYARAERGR